MEEEQSEFRHWDELLPDVFGLIFTNLPLQELLTIIPCVCKSWRKTVRDPHCWQDIDLDEWSCRWQPHQLDRMLRMLVRRSSGSFRNLHVSGLKNDSIFSFIIEKTNRPKAFDRRFHDFIGSETSSYRGSLFNGNLDVKWHFLPFAFASAGSLQVLRLPHSKINDSIVEQIAPRLSTVTFLDLSYCPKIGAQAIEAIGKHCKLLVTLCHNMYSPDSAGKVEPEDEANAIATTMPRLKYLELGFHFISTECVLNILSSCPQLEHLVIDGCPKVKLDRKFLKEKYPKLKVVGPHLVKARPDKRFIFGVQQYPVNDSFSGTLWTKLIEL
ncbi:hypothetical protein Gotur_025236 [Gossypium turneri]